ncbi:MAG: PASTA domain-containing protein, partial [Acidimicrobiales bacterium]|nr:PASTA domain-containing protein [Acidimicrobiales bacterium]
VSAGLPQALIPPVTSLLEDSAVQALEELGFAVNVIYEALPAFSPNDGRVISQSPQPEVEVDLGTIVTVVVGRSESLNLAPGAGAANEDETNDGNEASDGEVTSSSAG